MIVAHDLKAVFLHIPKTGGSSVASALGISNKELVVGRTKHHIVPDKIPAGYLRFSFVRNPWDRMISYYMFRTKEERAQSRRNVHPRERELGFKEWLFALDEFAEWENINPAFKIAILPQAETLGELPDFIGRFENLEGDFQALCERIGIAPPILKNKNRTNSKIAHYSNYYDDESRAWVAKRFQSDIKAYDYSFEFE